MKMGRLAVTGAALMALAGLSACTGNETPAASSAGSSPAAESGAAAASSAAAKELAAAALKVTESSGKIHMAMAGGMTGEGAFDTPNKALDVKMSMAGLGDVSIREVGTDLYMKFGGTAAKSFGAKWMHVDASKMPATSSLSLEKNDPRNTAKLLEQTTDVKKSGNKFSGTLDVSKSPSLTAEMVKAMQGRSTQVPFTAEVDAKGYLTKMTMDMNSVAQGAGSVEASYTDIGSTVAIPRPAKAQTVEMSDSVLKTLGG
ncbi:hypothetical protein Acy02nite_73810 [Actinoplanes cyaneus]|uniref:Lipoprotein n=1 Tax=Actinoplanes cyaneus TaxID=52696 RepID=A0A919M4L2_9ACTN|nr:hypothetical protein [Actinoplanes cyaneus]MCW2135502.1 hypothetical protein [Actinoplanes cyaneus]GID69500.1 hypothetical protein Acy02nite_73810 [Actinoplanes cyaneus]